MFNAFCELGQKYQNTLPEMSNLDYVTDYSFHNVICNQ